MYRHFLLAFACFIFCSSTVFSQSPRKSIPFDSLRFELTQAKSRKTEIDAYLKLGSAFYASNMADSLFYYSQKIDTTNGYGLAGKNFLKGLAYYRDRQLRKAITHLEEAQKTLESENREFYFQCLQTLGVAYIRTEQLQKAKTNFRTMLDQLKEGDNSRFKIGANGNLAMVYRNLGDYNKAITHFERSIAYDPDNSFSVANCCLNIATMFGNLEMYKKAVETLKKVDTATISNHPIYAAYNNNLAENYYFLGEYELAKRHYQVGIRKATALKQFHLAIKPNVYLSKIAFVNENYEEAKARLKDSFNALNKRPIPQANVSVNLWAAEYFLKTDRPDSSLYHANLAVKSAYSANVQHTLENVYELISEAYEKKGNTKNSNTYLKRHNKFTDSIQSVGKLKLLAEARAKYEVSETKDQLAETAEEASFFEKLSFRIGIVVVLLIGICSVLYVKFFRQKQTSALDKAQIETLNKKLEELKAEEAEKPDSAQRLLLKSKAVIDLSDLMFIKSDGPYLEFHLNEKNAPEIDRNTLKAIIEELPPNQFVQVHRSYIVNLNFVRSIFSNKLMLKSGDDINISRSFKANIEKVLITPA